MDPSSSNEFLVLDKKDIDDYNEDGILPQTPEVFAEILRWLQPTDYLAESSEYNKHLNEHVLGTSLWIQETEAYRLWHDSPEHGSLWVKGIAGAGKSVIAAMLADQLTQEKVPVVTFFFRQIIATNHDPQTLSRDWISMILKYSPPLQARMKKYMDDKRTLDNISFSEFWQDLVEALVSLPKVYCIVDALDEMDIDKQAFLKDLVSLGQRKPSTVKLLMTSRPLPRIETFLKDPSILQVKLEQSKVDKDIAFYLECRVKNAPEIELEMRKPVIQGIASKAQGSFLYARLMTDELLGRLDKGALDFKSIQNRLDSLPLSLADMYTRMLYDHSLRSSVPQVLQLSILQWVTHSTRPLRLLELAVMVASVPRPWYDKDTKSMVRTACGPLLEIFEDETVSVIHHSFTEFLVDPSRSLRNQPNALHPQFPVVSSYDAHRSMALICLNYLRSGSLSEWKIEKGSSDRQKKLQPLKLSYPFVEYAIDNWYVHVRKSGPLDDELLFALDLYMKQNNAAFSAWLNIIWPWSGSQDMHNLSILHVASWAGIATYVRYLLDSGGENNLEDDKGRTPLSWAAERGHTEVVSLLLEEVSDPDRDDKAGLKPLHYAARANHHGIVKLLIDAGVSPLTPKTKDHRRCGNAPSTLGQSPLMYASQSGSTESVEVMIPFLEAKDLSNSLCWAASCGKSRVVDLLLQHQASIDPPEDQDTPLFLAAKRASYEIMHVLLKNGADPNRRSQNARNRRFYSPQSRKSNYGFCPLHALCGLDKRKIRQDPENVVKCIRLLLEYGGDINAADETGQTPLHHAVRYDRRDSNDSIPKLLLDKGADPNAQDHFGNTPLHLVRLNTEDSTFVLGLLLAKGGDLSIRRKKDGGTPIHAMMDNGNEIDVSSLLMHVSDWNLQDSNGNTPLHILIATSNSPRVPLRDLVAAGADINIKNKAGEAPIHLVRRIAGPVEKSILPDILAAGASLSTRDKNGRTYFLRNTGCTSVLHGARYLLDLGLDLNARDYNGNCALHLICKNASQRSQHIESIQALVAAGADPLSVNHAGDTLLHEVMAEYTTGISLGAEHLIRLIHFLLDLGIPPRARNNIGQTALHLAMKLPPPSQCAGFGRQALLDEVMQIKGFELLDAEDYNGIRPIHLAATVSESLLGYLIGHGADANAVTHEDMSVLHIASKSRQSNSIGFLLDHFAKLGKTDMLHLRDKGGMTALHYACRSGRPESVALLLKAGSDPNARDDKNRLPLHHCAEFEIDRIQEATRVERPDPLRADVDIRFNMWDFDPTDNDSTRIREIVRLLIEHGSVVPVEQETSFDGSVIAPPLAAAVSTGCAEMVDELRSHIEKIGDGTLRPMLFRERYLINLTKPTISKDDLQSDEDVLNRCKDLLSLKQHKAIQELPALGADFSPRPGFRRDFMTILASQGYADLFEKLGTSVKQTGWTNGLASPRPNTQEAVLPYLITAAHRSLPNLDMLKVLVEQFNADINIQPEGSIHKRVPGDTALHVLARGDHWWNVEAVKYLLSRGANPELKNAQGRSVLNNVSGPRPFAIYRDREILRILLEHGADPNSTDENGSTRLNKSMHDIEQVRLLIKHGAQVSNLDRSTLIDAIGSLDVAAVAILLEVGADPNLKPMPIEDPKKTVEPQQMYPLHYAASAKFNIVNQRESAIPIINLLLDKGADPYLECNNGTSIINDIFQNGGIIKPFLDYPDLRLEEADSKGRTLLLAACQSSYGSTQPTTFPYIPYVSSEERIKERLRYTKGDLCRSLVVYEKGGDLAAVDHQGNNALHLLLGTTTHDDDEYRKTVRIFLEKAPALLHQKNAAGNTPFHISLTNWKYWAAELMIEAGASPLEKDGQGNIPLHHFAWHMCTNLVNDEWLPRFERYLSFGLDINEKNDNGETPVFNYFRGIEKDAGLFKGNTRAHREYFQPWETAGADLFVRNNEGETLLHLIARTTKTPYAMCNDVVDTFKFLMEKGLDPMVEDIHQRTALDIAAACSNQAILDLFKRDGT